MAEIKDNKIVTYDDISTKLNEHQSTSNECPPKVDIVNTYVTVSKEPYGTELVPYADNQCVQYKDIVLGLVDITIEQSAGGTISIVYDGTTYTSGTFKALAGRDLQISTTYHATDSNYKIIWWDGDTSKNRTWTVTGPTVVKADYYQFNTNSSTATKIYDANNFTLNITSLKNTVAQTYQVDIPSWATVTKNSSNVVFNLTANTALDDRTYTIVYTQNVSGLTGSFTLTQGGRRTYVKWGDSSNISNVSKEGATYSRPLVYSSTYSSTTGYYNKQAKVTSTAAWLTYSDPTITVAKNEYAAIETGVLKITNNGITGLVPQGDLDIQVQRLGRTRTVAWSTTSTWTPSNTANSTTRTIVYSGDYIAGKFEPTARVSSSESWCHVSISGTTVSLSVDTNVIGCSQPSRSATITLLVGGAGQDGLSVSGVASFTVTQALWQTNCSFSTNTTSLSWGTGGGTSTVTVSNSDGSTTANWELDLTGMSNRYSVVKTNNTTITVTASNSISSTVLNSSFKIRQLGCCSNTITINLSTAAWAKTKNSTLSISPTSWSPSKYGASQTFTATSYIDIYTEGTNGEYVRNYPTVNWTTSGSGFTLGATTGTSVSVTASDNSDGDYRTGSVTINNGYLSRSASISQEGASYEFSSRYSVSPGCDSGSSDWTEIVSTKNGNSQPWSITTGTSSGWSASPSSGSNGTRLTITNNSCNNGGSDYIVLTQQGSGNTLRINWTNSSGCCCEGYYTYTVNTNTPGATVKFGSYTTVTADSSGVATYRRCGSVGCITVTVSKDGYISQSKSVCADGSWTISGGLVKNYQFYWYGGNTTGKTDIYEDQIYASNDTAYNGFGLTSLKGSTVIGGTITTSNTSLLQPHPNGLHDYWNSNDGHLHCMYKWTSKNTSNSPRVIDLVTATQSESGNKIYVRQVVQAYVKFLLANGDTSWYINIPSTGLDEFYYTLTCKEAWDGVTPNSAVTKYPSDPTWSVTSYPSWITCTTSSGKDGEKAYFKCGANTGAQRSGDIVFTESHTGKTCKVTATQSAGAVSTQKPKIIFKVTNSTTSTTLYKIQYRIAGAIVATQSSATPGSTVTLTPTFEADAPNDAYTFSIYASTTATGTPIAVSSQSITQVISGDYGSTTEVNAKVSL